MRYLINIFISYYQDENWSERIEIFDSLNIKWYKEPSFGHHRGYACQGVLDTNKKETLETCNNIKDKLGNVIIVLSLVDVSKLTFPIGQCNDKQLVEPGRNFDKLVRKEQFGIYFNK